MNRLTRTLLQLVEDLENQLDSALKSCNTMDRLNQQLDELRLQHNIDYIRIQELETLLKKSPPTPGLSSAPSVTLSDDQSHWVVVSDEESPAVPTDGFEVDEPPEVPESLQSFKQRNRAKPEHNE